jgi:hypothetical protein
MSSEAFDILSEEMLKKLLEVNPDAGTALGLHDPYDFRLPHGGAKRYADTLELFKAWSEKSKTLARSEDLDNDQMISVKCVDLSSKFLEFLMTDYPIWRMNPDATDPGNLLFVMIGRDYAPYEWRAKAMSARIEAMPTYLEQFRTRFQGTRAVKVWTEMSIEATEQMPGFLQFIVTSSKGRVPDELLNSMKRNVEKAEEAIKEQMDWLNHLLDGAERNFPMGRKTFEKLLSMRGLGMDSDEIVALGEMYLKEFKDQRVRVSERIAPGKGVEAAMASVQSRSPKNFDEALKATVDEMEKAKRFIIDHDIASLDESAKLSVIETPAFMAPLLPYAAMFMSSKFDRVQEGMYIVTRPKDPKDLAKHLNYAAITNTAVHEAYPGHFHQSVIANRRTWIFQLLSGTDAMWAGAETVEGWAHYCEKMMFDHGYEATDDAELEMLNGAIWRACRIIADVKLARGEATIQELVDWMVEETGMARNATTAEVKRYSLTPGQALSYMLGRSLILGFREEVEKRMGSKFDEKRFHDSVASYGYLPYPLLREAVLSDLGT